MGQDLDACFNKEREDLVDTKAFFVSLRNLRNLHLCEEQNVSGTDQSNAIMFSSSAPCTACVSQRELLLAYEEKEKTKVGNAVAH